VDGVDVLSSREEWLDRFVAEPYERGHVSEPNANGLVCLRLAYPRDDLLTSELLEIVGGTTYADSSCRLSVRT